jgi:hypothetical protein
MQKTTPVIKRKAGVHDDPDLAAENLKDLLDSYKKLIHDQTGNIDSTGSTVRKFGGI